jgi:hypothetical protein
MKWCSFLGSSLLQIFYATDTWIVTFHIMCKVKVKLSLCLTKYHAITTYPVLNQAPRHEDVWGSAGIAAHILTLALDGGEWSASHPGRFTPRSYREAIVWPGPPKHEGRMMTTLLRRLLLDSCFPENGEGK